MDTIKKAGFSFEQFQIKSFSLNEPDNTDGTLALDFNPSGKYYPKEGRYDVFIDFSAFLTDGSSEDNISEEAMVKCLYRATFKFEVPLAFNDLPDFFFANSVAISFPYLRSFVSTLTLQANIKPLMLPLMNLTGIEQQLKEKTEVIE
jgi:preprotein translocase subunit SecB